MFTHNLLPKKKLSVEETEQGRYYITPEGSRYPSVTTVLDINTDHKAIEEWKMSVGEIEADRILQQSITKGNRLHNSLEKYALNENYTKIKSKMLPTDLDLFLGIKKFLDENVDEIYGIELPLYSNTLKIAGRTDLVGKYKEQNSIIDYKNSRKEKKEEWLENYFLQSSAYALMVEELYKITIPQIVVLISSPYGTQEFVKNKNDYVKKTIQVINKYHKEKT